MANAFDINDTIETDILDEGEPSDSFATGSGPHMPEDPDYVPPSSAALRALDAGIESAKTQPLVTRKIRVKRTEAAMKASFEGDPLSEAAYVRRRVMALEEKISELLTGASDDARALILSTKALEHLKRYY